MTNQIQLTGVAYGLPELHHEVNNEKWYVQQLRVKRLPNSKIAADLINVLISEREPVINEIQPGVTYSITGKVIAHEQDHRKSIYALMDKVKVVSSKTNHFNRVDLTGVIVKKLAPLHTTRGGVDVMTVSLAVNNRSKTNYIPVVVFNKNARWVDSLSIGTEIEVSGMLQSRSYTKRGELRTTYEISATSIQEVK